MDKHLTRVDHVTAVLSSWYAASAVLRKLHNLAPYHVCIYAKQFNSGAISDVKTGLRVGHLVSPPRLSNEMAANSSNNMHGLVLERTDSVFED